jgi:hypothetical protein
LKLLFSNIYLKGEVLMDQENLMEQLHLRYTAFGINSDTPNMELGSSDVQCTAVFSQYDSVLCGM